MTSIQLRRAWHFLTLQFYFGEFFNQYSHRATKGRKQRLSAVALLEVAKVQKAPACLAVGAVGR